MPRKKLEASVPVKCSTCGKTDYTFPEVKLPPGYELECAKCKAGSPGKPQKTVRHCSLCREPIIVMGVGGGVRLTCPQCANRDPKLIEIESLVSECDKYRNALNEQAEGQYVLTEKLDKLEADFTLRLNERMQETLDENLALKAQLAQREETTLADRLKVKMRAKYGETEQEKLKDFLEWLAGSEVLRSRSGMRPGMALTSWTSF